jgi:hypothetical protein
MNKLTVIAVLLAASANAFAGDGAPRSATGVGPWIAAQGNAALRVIADEIRRDLVEHLKELLPDVPAPATPAQPVAARAELLVEA